MGSRTPPAYVWCPRCLADLGSPQCCTPAQLNRITTVPAKACGCLTGDLCDCPIPPEGAPKVNDQFDAPGTVAPKRDRYGRYLLPDPDTGREQAWTRATTWAKSCADTTALSKWSQRMVAKGIAMRQDLYALAAAAHVDDKQTLDRVAADAKEAAGSSAGANSGTALHSFTERLDRGEDVQVPDPWRADIEAYRATMAGAGITVDPRLIERITVVRDLAVAGTFDRIVTVPSHGLLIGDLKTGKDLSYSWGEIAIQLALYAHADAMWNTDAGQYEPMPDVNLEQALVIHLPVGKARCDLYQVDIAAGWEMAQVCGTVRRWRTRRDLATPHTTWAAPTATDPVLAAIATAGNEDTLTNLWRQHMAVWTDTHTTAAKQRKAALTP